MSYNKKVETKQTYQPRDPKEWARASARQQMGSTGNFVGMKDAAFTYLEDATHFCVAVQWDGVIRFFSKYVVCANRITASNLCLKPTLAEAGYLELPELELLFSRIA